MTSHSKGCNTMRNCGLSAIPLAATPESNELAVVVDAISNAPDCYVVLNVLARAIKTATTMTTAPRCQRQTPLVLVTTAFSHRMTPLSHQLPRSW